MILQNLILPALTFSLLIADPEYYSGIGIDKEQNVAREKAKSEIAKQIQSIVNTKFESVKIENLKDKIYSIIKNYDYDEKLWLQTMNYFFNISFDKSHLKLLLNNISSN